MRRRVVAAELRLRGRDPGSVPPANSSCVWPEPLSPLWEQVLEQAPESSGALPGRISIPSGAHGLWAQHKYSVMARSPQSYKEIGQEVAGTGKGPPSPQLFAWLLELLRAPPPLPRSRNAISHMWGYVSKSTTPDVRALAESELDLRPRRVLDRVAALSRVNNVTYILESTALGELGAHLPDDAST